MFWGSFLPLCSWAAKKEWGGKGVFGSLSVLLIHPSLQYLKKTLLYLPGISAELSIVLSLQSTRCQGLMLRKDDMVRTSICHWIKLSPHLMVNEYDRNIKDW